MSRAANGRAHLSIGEVLSLLQDEFPDVTISKIRFLESQGLLDPERTPSGYRKFYDDDIDRLRWILRQQKDHYLPLKVIKDRLDADEHIPGSSATNGTGEGHGASAARAAAAAAVVVSPRLGTETKPVMAKPPAARGPGAPSEGLVRPPGAGGAAPGRPGTGTGAPSGPSGPSGPAAPSQAGRSARAPVRPGGTQSSGAGRRTEPGPSPSASGASGASAPGTARSAQGRPGAAPGPRPGASRALPPSSGGPSRTRPPGSAGTAPSVSAAQPGPALPERDAVSLSLDELAEASGLSARDVRDLERFGLIEPRETGGTSTYDGDALVIAQTAAGFLQHGIEARHMRTYKVAVDREAGLFEQIVSPVLKQRNPEARTRAARTVTELIRLGEVMRGVLLRRELRDLQGGA